MKLKVAFFILLALVAAASFLIYQESLKKDVNISMGWDNKSGKKLKETLHLQVPDAKYDDFFAEILGTDTWDNAKKLYRQHVGLKKFMNGDIFSVTTAGNRTLSYDLHHYINNSKGEKISFVRRGREFVRKNEPIDLEEKTMIRFYTIKNSLAEDDPQFYEIAKERLIWDWGILDKLKPGDSIAFMVKGIFDRDILVKTYGILGFSVKSVNIGEFTMTAFRDYIYGDYFVSGYTVVLSPPGDFRAPIDSGRITSYFGTRSDPFNKRKKFHSGVDILAKIDTPVRAAESGTVIFAGEKGGLGNAIVIDHGNGLRTVYGHLNRFLTTNGRRVTRGEIIAGAGSTGRSTAPHLHFTVMQDGKSVDPLLYTYERVWTAPFDISGSFRTLSTTRTLQLERAIDNKRSFFIKESKLSSSADKKR
ncbi:M23 family metallopeptidase [bacterium]|nr:M23 family metallopeptidase [bacterium]